MFDAEGMILGRLASATADLLLKAAREDRDDKVIIVNAEKAIVSGSKTSVFNKYQEKPNSITLEKDHSSQECPI